MSTFLCLFVYMLVLCDVGYTQIIEEGIETTTAAVPSNLICSTCECTNETVNCVARNLSGPFELTDWDGLRSLAPKTVDLSGNSMQSVTRIAKLPIQVMNMSNCDISTIEDASFMYLENMTTLDLSRNKISTNGLTVRIFIGPIIPGVVPKSLRNFRYLSMAYNDIHSLPQDLFVFMTGLTYLDLSGNPLAYIDQVTLGAMSDLVNLEEIRLSGCELETLPEGLFRRQRRLRKLDLSDNRFTKLPTILQEPPNLIYLNFDKNPVESLDAETAKLSLTNLKELSLSRLSKLQSVVKSALGGVPNLVTLRLAYNPRLTTVDPYFLMTTDEDEEEQWPLLKELYMNNNNISTVDAHFLDKWSSLVTGDFSNNPYVCDCNNQWMVDVLAPLLASSPANGTLDNMICKKPADVRGLTFAQLASASKTLVCPESENISLLPEISNTAIILGVMIGIIVTFPIVLVLVLLWRRGYFAKCRTRKVEDYDDDETENL